MILFWLKLKVQQNFNSSFHFFTEAPKNVVKMNSDYRFIHNKKIVFYFIILKRYFNNKKQYRNWKYSFFVWIFITLLPCTYFIKNVDNAKNSKMSISLTVKVFKVPKDLLWGSSKSLIFSSSLTSAFTPDDVAFDSDSFFTSAEAFLSGVPWPVLDFSELSDAFSSSVWLNTSSNSRYST